MVIANCSAETADRIQSPSSDVQTGDAGRHLYDEIGDYGCLNVTTADNAGLAPETRRTSADWSQAYEASFFNKDDFSDIYGDLDRAGPLTSDRPAALGEEINSEGVKQGSSGTCFFMSSLASLANTEAGQKQIADMVRENPDGTFTVTFPGDQDNPVTIDDIGSKANDGAAKWAQVIETAFLKYTHDGPLRDTVDLQDVSVTARVNNSKTAQKLLTGKDSMNDQFAFTDMASGLSAIGSTSMDNVERDLEEAIKNGRVITAGTAPDGILGTGSNDSGPVRDGHIFTVMNYDSETKTVTVRDPYGNSGIAEGETVDGITALPNGELKMSLDKFY
ncbi:MAG: hypothetical protein K8F91_14345, partial [Candidatus Obscuribacterales bacterium]|nr:hypothetical protein [Candidatus Obscuribacterales bacterium]